MEFRRTADLDITREISGRGLRRLDPVLIYFRNVLHDAADKIILQKKFTLGMIPPYKGAWEWQRDSGYLRRAGAADMNEYWLDAAERDARLRICAAVKG